MCLARGMYFSRKTAGLPKARPASPLGLVEQSGQIGGFVHHAHAASAAAEGRLDDEREADFLRDLQAPRSRSSIGIFRAGQRGDADLLRQRAGGDLVAHQFEQLRRGPTKVMPALAQARANSAFSERNP